MAPHAHDHGHAHDHDHGGHAHARGASERRLLQTLFLSGSYLLVEVAGGLWTGSLALLADAGHMLSDTAALGIALVALRLARRPPDARRTYGYHRAEVLAAVLNAATLLAIAAGILYEAVERWQAPPTVDGPGMLAIAFGGLLVNLAALRLLAGGRSENLNVRAAWLHVASDALGSVGAMIAGVAVWLGHPVADPAASVLLAALIVHASWALLNEAVDVLMEGAPAHIDVAAVREALRGVEGVEDVHDLHVWTITSGMVALSCHARGAGTVATDALLGRLAAMLRERFGITHTTIQVEPPDYVEEALHP